MSKASLFIIFLSFIPMTRLFGVCVSDPQVPFTTNSTAAAAAAAAYQQSSVSLSQSSLKN